MTFKEFLLMDFIQSNKDNDRTFDKWIDTMYGEDLVSMYSSWINDFDTAEEDVAKAVEFIRTHI